MSKQLRPKRLEAHLIGLFYPEGSKAQKWAKAYIKQSDKKIEKGNTKTSSKV
jgi:hypothetical protein